MIEAQSSPARRTEIMLEAACFYLRFEASSMHEDLIEVRFRLLYRGSK